jgi:hypothetical protein
MGWDTSRLEDKPAKQLECSVCLDLFKSPVFVCTESHTLCKECCYERQCYERQAAQVPGVQKTDEAGNKVEI